MHYSKQNTQIKISVYYASHVSWEHVNLVKNKVINSAYTILSSFLPR